MHTIFIIIMKRISFSPIYKFANNHKIVGSQYGWICIILRAVNPLCIVRLSCRKGKAMSHFRLGWMGMTFRQYTSSSSLYAQKDTHNLTEFCCPLWHDCQTKSRSENCQKMCACVNWCSLPRMFPFRNCFWAIQKIEKVNFCLSRRIKPQ